MRLITFFLIYSLLIIGIVFIPNVAKTQIDSGTVSIRDAIAILSSSLGIKIIVDGNIEGMVDLDLSDQSPKQIKENLEQKLNEAGYFWVAEGGIVHITKNPKAIQGAFRKQLPLSYYISIISQKNLFRPLGIPPVEIKSDLVLTGIFGIGEASKAIIEDVTNKKSYYISRGESIGNSKVIEITENQVILDGPNGRSVLKIQKQKEN
jgi:type II secretory pathway component GspD/PulD (secretin)